MLFSRGFRIVRAEFCFILQTVSCFSRYHQLVVDPTPEAEEVGLQATKRRYGHVRDEYGSLSSVLPLHY